MNERQVEYILAVDKHRSFGKAADACFITQSTLSTMIGKFEKQRGVVIFNRKSKPIELTVEGLAIVNQLKNIKREFDHLEEVIQELKGVQKGELRIAGIPTIAPYVFPMILNKLIKQFPKIQFTIQELTTKRIIEDIKHGNIDIGLVSTPLKEKDLRELKLYEEPFMIYDRRQRHQKKLKTKLAISELDPSQLWLLEEGHCFRNQVEKICNLRQKKVLNNNLNYKSGSISSLKKFVAINKGMTLLPYLSINDLNKTERQYLKYFKSPTPVREIGLLVHKNFIKEKLLSGLEVIIKDAVEGKLENMKDTKVYVPF